QRAPWKSYSQQSTPRRRVRRAGDPGRSGATALSLSDGQLFPATAPRSAREPESYAERPVARLVAETLLQQDAVDVHHHPVVELAPFPVFRLQISFDQLGDLIERKLVSRLLFCRAYGSGQVLQIFANSRYLRFRRRRRPVRGHDVIKI